MTKKRYRRLREPAQVKIGVHPHTVHRVPGKTMGDRLGDSDPDGLTIRLRKFLRRSKAREILLHEIIHLCDFQIPEKWVDRLAPILLGVLRDNPELITYLLGE